MDHLYKSGITEIVQKVCERYRLERYGLLPAKGFIIDRLIVIKHLQQAYQSGDLPAFRKLVLQELEKYCTFEPLYHDSALLFNWLYVIYKLALNEIRRSSDSNGLLDNEIQILPRTISFKDSRQILKELANKEIYRLSEACSPQSIERRLLDDCRKVYPVSIDDLLNYLKKEDDAFWHELSMATYNITGSLVRYMDLQKPDSEDMQSEVWFSAENTIRERILSGKNEAFENGTHLRNFIRKICQNDANNYLRKFRNYSKRSIPLDALMEKDIQLIHEEKTLESPEPDVDIHNEPEVQAALVRILYLETNPIYDLLTADIRDKVEMFMLKYVDQLSYDEIVSRMHNEKIAPDDRKKLVENCRQAVCRVKNTLMERFRKYLKSQELPHNQRSKMKFNSYVNG